MPPVKALCFDVFGTVVDWREGVARDAAQFLQTHKLHGLDPRAFADAWRGLYQPAMQECRAGRRPYVQLDTLHRENLEAVLRQYGLCPSTLPEESIAWLNDAWRRLDPWPDAVQGITRLKSKYIVAPASNGNIALMVAMAKRAGLPWDAILGAEVTGAYKPAPQSYLRMADVLRIAPESICMVAAHNDDLAAAQACGLSTAFVARPTEHGPGQNTDLSPEGNWNFVATDFNHLAHQLGC